MKKQAQCFVFTLFVIFVCQAQEIQLRERTLVRGLATVKDTVIGQDSVIRVIMDPSVKLYDEPTFVKLDDFVFKDGTIEVDVLSKFLPDAPQWARGFIGVAFRINSDNSKFESLYIRPDNGRSDDQIRRNHSTQYYAYPGYKFERLRKEEPEKYESYADMEMNRWIRIKIVVKGEQAKLYINGNSQPSLIVKDMKHGAKSLGSIGLWVGPGTEGYFKNLKIVKD